MCVNGEILHTELDYFVYRRQDVSGVGAELGTVAGVRLSSWITHHDALLAKTL